MTHVEFSQQRRANMTLEGGFGFASFISIFLLKKIKTHCFLFMLSCSYTSDAICECLDPGPVIYLGLMLSQDFNCWIIFYKLSFQ